MLLRVRWLGAVLLILTAVSPAWPCNVPVFRYALERWTPDDCTVTVFHRGPLTPEQIQHRERLRKFGHDDGGRANLLIEVVDLDGDVSPVLERLWKAQKNATLPWIAVQEPHPEDATSWRGLPLADDVGFRKLTDSPARRKIVEHLLKGESVVWLQLDSGNARADADTAKLLEETSAKLAKELKLPEGIGDPGSTLMSRLPLRISFVAVHVSRTDPEEAALVGLLGHIFPLVAKTTGPVVVPIFGRGRALDAVIGEDLTAETLTDAAVFLTDRCSCQVKRLNPGVDLLFTANWESIFSEETADPARPSQEVPLVSLPEPETPKPEQPEAVAVCDTVEPPPSMLPRVLMWSVGGAGVGLVLGTVLVLRRRGGAA